MVEKFTLTRVCEGKMSFNYFSVKFITRGTFFSQSSKSHTENGLRIKTGLQGCKYLRNSYTHFTPGVPNLAPRTLLK